MTCYAVIDTNVLVSALLSCHEDASPVQVVSKIFTGEIIPLYSHPILNEYSEVLRRKKFQFTSSLVDSLLSTIQQLGILITPSPSHEILPDKKDLPFYELVLETQVYHSYLITGNMKHFPTKKYIVTPNRMLQILSHS